MASVRKTRTGRWELTVTNKLLPKGRVWFTFDSEDEASAYGLQAEKWLAAGLVPPELQAPAAQDRSGLLGPIIRAWINTGEPSAADQEVLGRLFVEVGADSLASVNYEWCERWVRKMKLERNLAPGSIRKRVQALRRALDWHLRRSGQPMVGNPLHMLPRGYSAYTAKDAGDLVQLKMVAKVDQERERRLLPDEEARVRASLAGVRPEGRERALVVDQAFALLFEVILGTGLRLREAYRLRVGQVDLRARVLRPQASKTWHGRVKFKTVPLQPHVHAALASHLQRLQLQADDLLFPWWDGDEASLKVITRRLSARFAALFRHAGVADITEHDLRHEATCRWYELRAPDGTWLYRGEEVVRIMGWAPGSKMAQRYASFRAEDLAGRLWLVPGGASGPDSRRVG
jgi:integrase